VSTSLPDVGVVGLGAMGSRIARRLLAAGYRVHGWNRSASRVMPLAAAGLVPWPTPRAVAEHAGIVLSMVWDSAALARFVADRRYRGDGTAERAAQRAPEPPAGMEAGQGARP
jgi:3-hydroxyisobutyrate dehydrogenase-like beta-hydroxyacid dehydrogenase